MKWASRGDGEVGEHRAWDKELSLAWRREPSWIRQMARRKGWYAHDGNLWAWWRGARQFPFLWFLFLHQVGGIDTCSEQENWSGGLSDLKRVETFSNSCCWEGKLMRQTPRWVARQNWGPAEMRDHEHGCLYINLWARFGSLIEVLDFSLQCWYDRMVERTELNTVTEKQLTR